MSLDRDPELALCADDIPDQHRVDGIDGLSFFSIDQPTDVTDEVARAVKVLLARHLFNGESDELIAGEVEDLDSAYGLQKFWGSLRIPSYLFAIDDWSQLRGFLGTEIEMSYHGEYNRPQGEKFVLDRLRTNVYQFLFWACVDPDFRSRGVMEAMMGAATTFVDSYAKVFKIRAMDQVVNVKSLDDRMADYWRDKHGFENLGVSPNGLHYLSRRLQVEPQGNLGPDLADRLIQEARRLHPDDTDFVSALGHLVGRSQE